MWRKLLARVHPDSNGDHELFIWTTNLRDEICNGKGSGSKESGNTPPREGSARLKEAQEAEKRARGRWHDLRYQSGDIRREILRLEDAIKEGEQDAERDAKRAASPVVRSVWQLGPDPDDP